jgi:hypothetical protein
MSNRFEGSFKLTDDLDTALTSLLMGWHRLERGLKDQDIIDFNLIGRHSKTTFKSRLQVLDEIKRLRPLVHDDKSPAAKRLSAHETYLRALMGEKTSFPDYILNTQGIPVRVFSNTYLAKRRGGLERMLAELNISFDDKTPDAFRQKEKSVPISRSPNEFSSMLTTHRKYVEAITSTKFAFDIKMEFVSLDKYWTYWVDGVTNKFRLRFNRHKIKHPFTRSQVTQYVYHELLAHCGQMSGWRSQIKAGKLAKYFGLTTVHSPEQFLLEGVAQTLPLFIKNADTEDPFLRARVYLSHYRSLVNNNVHIMINDGRSIEECVAYVARHIPYEADADIAPGLASRANNILFRSYQFVYPSSFDFFVDCAERLPDHAARQLISTTYRWPCTFDQLTHLSARVRG